MDPVKAALTQKARISIAGGAADYISTLIEQMVGCWDVEQRMWPGPDAPANDLPAAVARREMIGTFVQELMELAPGAQGDAFRRLSCFGYNGVNRQYEYFSIDSRAPQMMFERSFESPDANAPQSELMLHGGIFVAPQWGEATNAAFRYRLGISLLEQDRQTVRLYLTPLSSGNLGEFLAFEYLYSRQK